MQPQGGARGLRLVIAAIIALGAIISYFGSTQINPATGEKQRIALDAGEEIALGLRAAPQMIRQFGGRVEGPAADKVTQIGNRIVERSDAAKSPYKFEFHLLDDNRTVNAFALPGGQIFLTTALASQLRTEGELAGVLGHEIGRVVGRHGAEHLAKQNLTQGLVGATAVAADDSRAAMLAQAVGQMVDMKYGRDDELESDVLGVKYLAQAGFDPRAMIGVMEVLAKAAKGGRQPEFFSTHPNPENRIGNIKKAIEQVFPNGVPADLKR